MLTLAFAFFNGHSSVQLSNVRLLLRRRLEEREQLHGEKETLRIIRFISLSCQSETNLDVMFLRLSKRKDKHGSRVMQGKKKKRMKQFLRPNS